MELRKFLKKVARLSRGRTDDGGAGEIHLQDVIDSSRDNANIIAQKSSRRESCFSWRTELNMTRRVLVGMIKAALRDARASVFCPWDESHG